MTWPGITMETCSPPPDKMVGAGLTSPLGVVFIYETEEQESGAIEARRVACLA